MYESGEDYLEAILMIQEQNGSARSIDVARKLNVSKPSVSRAMGILREGGFVEFSETGELVLTQSGLEKAKMIYGRHVLLTKFLQKITGVSFDQAEENACRLEHDVDEDIVHGIECWMAVNP